MKLFIAINLGEEIKYALMDIQDAMMDCGMTGNYTSEANTGWYIQNYENIRE